MSLNLSATKKFLLIYLYHIKKKKKIQKSLLISLITLNKSSIGFKSLLLFHIFYFLFKTKSRKKLTSKAFKHKNIKFKNFSNLLFYNNYIIFFKYIDYLAKNLTFTNYNLIFFTTLPTIFVFLDIFIKLKLFNFFKMLPTFLFYCTYNYIYNYKYFAKPEIRLSCFTKKQACTNIFNTMIPCSSSYHNFYELLPGISFVQSYFSKLHYSFKKLNNPLLHIFYKNSYCLNFFNYVNLDFFLKIFFFIKVKKTPKNFTKKYFNKLKNSSKKKVTENSILFKKRFFFKKGLKRTIVRVKRQFYKKIAQLKRELNLFKIVSLLKPKPFKKKKSFILKKKTNFFFKNSFFDYLEYVSVLSVNNLYIFYKFTNFYLVSTPVFLGCGLLYFNVANSSFIFTKKFNYKLNNIFFNFFNFNFFYLFLLLSFLLVIIKKTLNFNILVKRNNTFLSIYSYNSLINSGSSGFLNLNKSNMSKKLYFFYRHFLLNLQIVKPKGTYNRFSRYFFNLTRIFSKLLEQKTLSTKKYSRFKVRFFYVYSLNKKIVNWEKAKRLRRIHFNAFFYCRFKPNFLKIKYSRQLKHINYKYITLYSGYKLFLNRCKWIFTSGNAGCTYCSALTRALKPHKTKRFPIKRDYYFEKCSQLFSKHKRFFQNYNYVYYNNLYTKKNKSYFENCINFFKKYRYLLQFNSYSLFNAYYLVELETYSIIKLNPKKLLYILKKQYKAIPVKQNSYKKIFIFFKNKNNLLANSYNIVKNYKSVHKSYPHLNKNLNKFVFLSYNLAKKPLIYNETLFKNFILFFKNQITMWYPCTDDLKNLNFNMVLNQIFSSTAEKFNLKKQGHEYNKCKKIMFNDRTILNLSNNNKAKLSKLPLRVQKLFKSQKKLFKEHTFLFTRFLCLTKFDMLSGYINFFTPIFKNSNYMFSDVKEYELSHKRNKGMPVLKLNKTSNLLPLFDKTRASLVNYLFLNKHIFSGYSYIFELQKGLFKEHKHLIKVGACLFSNNIKLFYQHISLFERFENRCLKSVFKNNNLFLNFKDSSLFQKTKKNSKRSDKYLFKRFSTILVFKKFKKFILMTKLIYGFLVKDNIFFLATTKKPSLISCTNLTKNYINNFKTYATFLRRKLFYLSHRLKKHMYRHKKESFITTRFNQSISLRWFFYNSVFNFYELMLKAQLSLRYRSNKYMNKLLYFKRPNFIFSKIHLKSYFNMLFLNSYLKNKKKYKKYDRIADSIHYIKGNPRLKLLKIIDSLNYPYGKLLKQKNKIKKRKRIKNKLF